MTPTRLLIGQITIVFAIVVSGVWAATQTAMVMLGYQAQLGAPPMGCRSTGHGRYLPDDIPK